MKLNFILAFCGVACCLWALTPAPADHPDTDRRWWVAVLGAVVASLSTLSGLLTWFAFLPAIWQRGRVARVIWCLTAAAILIPYANGFPRGTTALASLRDDLDYALVCLGAPLGAGAVPLARLWGLGGVVGMAALLLAYRYCGGQWRRLVSWLGLALHALGTVLVTTIGRAWLGTEQALASRHWLFSALWWVALLVIGYLAVVAVRRAAVRRPPRVVGRVTVLICLVGGLPLLLGLGQANRDGFVDGLN